MRVVATSQTCTDTFGPACIPGARAEHALGSKLVEPFLHSALARLLEKEQQPEEILRLPVKEDFDFMHSGAPPLNIPAMWTLTLFFLEKRPGRPPLLFLSFKTGDSASPDGLRRCFSSVPSMLFFKNKETRFTYCNPAFSAACGLPPESILGKTAAELSLRPPLDVLLTEHDRKVLDTGETCFSQISAKSPEGRRLSYETQCFPDLDADGCIQGIFGICRDVSLAKETEEALQRQGELLQAANDAALMLFSDEDEFEELAWRVLAHIGVVTGADRVDVWRNHGSSEEGLLCTQIYSWDNDSAQDFFSPNANTAVYGTHLPGWESMLSGGKSVNTHDRAVTPQERDYLSRHNLGAAFAVPILFRSTFWGFIRIGTHSSSHGWGQMEEGTLRSVGLLLAATIQRRLIQEALSQSEERFRDVAMAAGEIVWELDAQGYFSYISERVFAITGYEPDEVLGKRWEDFSIEDFSEEVTGNMFQASVPTGSFRAFEHRIQTKDGRQLWLFTSGKLLTGEEGIAGLRGASLDVTHDRQTAANLNTTLTALEHANKDLETAVHNAHELARKAESASQAKSEFLANMSHEIRTPLNAIIGMAYLLLKTRLTAKQEDFTGKIHAAGVALLGVVNDILDFSKIESGKMHIEHLPFDMGELLDNLAAIIGAKAEEKDLDVTLFIERNVPRRLIGDPLRLGQVLNNIAGNAVKFTEQGGISVRCRLHSLEQDKAHIRIIVSDTGIGIPKERQSQLFQSFFQADSSITRKYGGTGLGLVIAKNMLELAGGAMSIDSVPGHGTSVTVDIPLALDKDAGEAASSLEGSPLLGMSVFLVDTSDLQRESLQEMLLDMGCRVTAFADLGQAFAAIASSDSASDSRPRALVLPSWLVLEENAYNLRHLNEVMHLANVPKVVCIAPFGFVESVDIDDDEIKPWIAAAVCRPVVSTNLRAALLRVASGTGFLIDEGQARKSRLQQVPYFPESRILLVEDNAVNQQIAVELLQEAGVTVTVADNGKIALDILESGNASDFDMIFMDLQMPEMDGFTSTAHIRALPRFEHIPIIAMTAHATFEERDRCLAAGMNEHISKPIDIATLYEALRRWLKPAQPWQAKFHNATLDDSPLPELPGLDTDAAVSALGADLPRYKNLLLQFFLQHAGTGEKLAKAFEAIDRQTALKLLAVIRDQSVPAGATRLHATAKLAVEQLLSPGQAMEKSMLQPVLDTLSETTGMLEALFHSPLPCELAAVPGPARVLLLDELACLNRLLGEDDAEACQLFHKLEPELRQINNTATATAAKAIAVFDFSNALGVLHPMENQLRTALADTSRPI